MTRSQDRGSSALEYALMIAAITGVLVVVVYALGSVLRDSFEKDLACLSKPVNPNAPC